MSIIPSAYHDMVAADLCRAGYVMPPRFTLADLLKLHYGIPNLRTRA